MHRFRPTPALIVAMIALFVALGGVGYAAHQIGTKNIQNNAITTKKIAPNAVTTGKIKNKAVTGSKLAGLSVGTQNLANHAVTSAKLGKFAVANGNLQSGAVEQQNIAAASVGNAQLSVAFHQSAQVTVPGLSHMQVKATCGNASQRVITWAGQWNIENLSDQIASLLHIVDVRPSAGFLGSLSVRVYNGSTAAQHFQVSLLCAK